MTESLSRRIVHSAVWVVGLRVAARLLGLISLMTLARILVPADYGLVALAGVFAGAIALLSSFNFEIWLIRHPTPGRAHFDTVWTLSIFRGLATAVLLAAAAGLLAELFDDPRLKAVLMVLAVGHALRGFQNVGVVEFQRDLDFDKDSILTGLSKLLGFVLALSVALTWRTYWALVVGIIAEQMAKLGLSFVMHRYRPKASLAHWYEAFQFSKWLLVSNMVGFAYRRGDTFVLGKLLSTELLGLYNVARELANMTSTEVIMPIRRVMLPAYAKFIDDRTRLRQAFLDGLGLILLFGVPAAVGIGLTADPLVRVILGEQWLAAIPLVKILALYGLAAVGLANQGPLLLALGKTRLYSNLNTGAVLLLIPSLWWAASTQGVVGGAWAASLTNVCFFAMTLIFTLRVTGVRLDSVFAVVWRTVFATLAMALIVNHTVEILLSSGLAAIVQLLVSALVGAFTFTGVVVGLWWLGGRPHGPEKLVADYLVAMRADPH